MLFLFYSPPLWLLYGALLCMLLATVPIARGVFVLFAKQPSKKVLLRTGYCQLTIFAVLTLLHFSFSQDLNYLASVAFYPGLPFGVFLAVPIWFMLSVGDTGWPIVAVLAALFNYAGILSIVHFIAGRWSITSNLK
jgi:hypothetical protein